MTQTKPTRLNIRDYLLAMGPDLTVEQVKDQLSGSLDSAYPDLTVVEKQAILDDVESYGGK